MTATTTAVAPPPPAKPRSAAGAGVRELMQLASKRDRVMLSIWVYAVVGEVAGSAYSYKGLYKTVESRVQFGTAANANGGLRAFYGVAYDPSSNGSLTTWRTAVMAGVLIGLMATFLVIRHTRAEEETGRLELVGAAAVSRHAALTAAVTLAVYSELMIGVLIGLIMWLMGLGAAGGFALGLGIAAVGMVFTGVAAVTAQLTESARFARGLAITVLAVSYLLRFVGDSIGATSPHWLLWTSPIGWLEQLRPYGGNRWWTLAIPLVATVVLLATAYALADRRDFGAGLVPARPGPARAHRSLLSVEGLTWRLQRATILGWAIGVVAFAVVLGSVANAVDALVSGNDQVVKAMQEMGGQKGLENAYFASMVSIMALVVAGFAMQALLRLRQEETAGRHELVLATATGRVRWAAGPVAIAVVGSTVLTAAFGVATGISAGLNEHNVGHHLPRMLGASLMQLPAIWLMAGLTFAVFGLRPRWSMGVYGLLGWCVLIGQFGPVFHFSQYVLDLSPFTHSPRLPGVTIDWTPVVILTVLAALLFAAGFVGTRRRDVG